MLPGLPYRNPIPRRQGRSKKTDECRGNTRDARIEPKRSIQKRKHLQREKGDAQVLALLPISGSLTITAGTKRESSTVVVITVRVCARDGLWRVQRLHVRERSRSRFGSQGAGHKQGEMGLFTEQAARPARVPLQRVTRPRVRAWERQGKLAS